MVTSLNKDPNPPGIMQLFLKRNKPNKIKGFFNYFFGNASNNFEETEEEKFPYGPFSANVFNKINWIIKEIKFTGDYIFDNNLNYFIEIPEANSNFSQMTIRDNRNAYLKNLNFCIYSLNYYRIELVSLKNQKNGQFITQKIFKGFLALNEINIEKFKKRKNNKNKEHSLNQRTMWHFDEWIEIPAMVCSDQVKIHGNGCFKLKIEFFLKKMLV